MDVNIASRLVKLRKQNGFSQEVLAEKIGVSRQAVSKWERSESSPDTDNLITLAKIYNLTIDEMIYNDHETGTSTTDATANENTSEDYSKNQGVLRKYLPFIPVIILSIIGNLSDFSSGWWYSGLLILFVTLIFVIFFKKK